MTLLFENETESDLPFDPEKTARRVIGEALTHEGCPYECEVSLTLTDENGIRDLNSRFRAIDSVTDVLSFPLVPFETPSAFDALDDMEDCFDPDTGDLMLGDIVICVPRMKEQAAEYGHPELREFAFLVAHSMFHLMGYDHMTEDEAKDMESRQEEVLRALDITRD
ncbi:MAG: rRNA maturation RNase YbeY [Lachnospiraceae bacterium]|jgi:probable rRNA maturation factor|nr:rRNA maturation RNase YbeY [Lachnospiraceae bacterium]MCI1327510.1 rRNA maturation RNase YbeY [Lachnospiraceae bacterium]